MKRQIANALVIVAVLPALLLADPPSLRRGTQGSNAFGQQANAKDSAAAKKMRESIPQTAEGKREWLRKRATQNVNSYRKIREANKKIAKLNNQQVDALVERLVAQQNVLAQQLPGQQLPNQAAAGANNALQQAQLELARARLLRQQLENQVLQQQLGLGNGFYPYGNNVGYLPQVTWLPQGTQFGTRAVVSPDRRHVRINAQPFFSSVGPVYSYNLNNGQTRLQPQYGVPQGNGFPLTYPNTNPYASPYGRQIVPQTQQQRTPSATPRVYYDGIRTRVGR